MIVPAAYTKVVFSCPGSCRLSLCIAPAVYLAGGVLLDEISVPVEVDLSADGRRHLRCDVSVLGMTFKADNAADLIARVRLAFETTSVMPGGKASA